MGYTLRREMGTRSALGRNKKMGWALYHNGSPVYPKFRNWWPTKAQGQSTISKAKAEERKAKRRAKKPKKKQKKRKKR